jgi:hypothetical protein
MSSLPNSLAQITRLLRHTHFKVVASPLEGFEDMRELPVSLADAAAVVIVQVRWVIATTAVVTRGFPERQASDAAFFFREGFDDLRIVQ